MWLFAILIGLFILSAPIVAIVALVRTSDLRQETARLNRAIAGLRAELAAFGGGEGKAPVSEPEAPTLPQAATPPETTSKPVDEEPPAAPVPPPPAPSAAPQPGQRAARKALEETLVSKWLVILAGIAGFLAAAFLYDYSVDMGWLGPTGQCLLGALAGVALIAGGEALRRHPFERAAALVKPSLIPPALVAVGVSFLFISTYAAYALFGLLAPLAAFFLLAIVWAAAMALSVVYGPFVAALGILGGFAVPILVQTGNPSAYSLFPYLLAVTASALGVLRYKGWGWLAWGALAGAAAWPVIWMVAEPSADLGAPAIGFYLTAVAAMFMYAPAGLLKHRTPVGLRHLVFKLPPPAMLAWAASTAMLVLALLLTWADGFGAGSVVWAGILAAFLMAAGRRDVTFDALAVAAALLSALVLASWDLPIWPGHVDVFATLPPGLLPFALAAGGYAALFGIAGLALLRGADRPGLWAGVSAAVPVAALAVAYWRITDFEVDPRWSIMGLALGAVNLGAAMWVSSRRSDSRMEGALAAYAVGVVASVVLAMTMALENAWLTVGLSLMLPAMGWIHIRTKVAALRIVTLIVAGAVLTRLVFNYEVFDYALGATPGLNWMLYGYGAPAIAFYIAARLFRRTADDRLVLALEAGALAFLTLFWTLEIADIVQGGQFMPGDSLLEASLRTAAWAVIGFALLWQCRAEKPRLAAVWGWRILAGLAGAQVVLVHLMVLNPMLTGDPVGAWPLLNVLLMAYAVPALFALAFMIETRRRKVPNAPQIAGIGSLVLVFVWLSLEVRHAFHGTRLDIGWTSDAEWYSYSAVWLVYALALLALGIWRRDTPLRYASLAVLLLTVVKVAADIWQIGGLYRVASLLGLMFGGLLIAGIYRRYVSPPDSEAGGGSPPAPQPAASS